MAQFNVYQSDDLNLFIDVAKEGVLDTTAEGAALMFIVLPAPGLAAARAVITKEGADVSAEPPKRFSWTVTAEDMAGLIVDKDYYWYVRYTDADGTRTTIDEGTLRLQPGVK
jgi:hypothetical protein